MYFGAKEYTFVTILVFLAKVFVILLAATGKWCDNYGQVEYYFFRILSY
jgi:hypothetical protein